MNSRNLGALVTGASAGIGRSIATSLAADGMNVVIFDVNVQGAHETAELIRNAGGQCEIVIGDVGDYEQIKGGIEKCISVYGGIDVLVNNAGAVEMNTIANTTLEQFERVFRINVDGVFYSCKAAAPHMMAQESGKIVNIASWFGKVGKPGYGAYSASKAAVIGLTQSLAMELAAYKVNVNAVCPGTIVETAMRDEADREASRLGLKTSRERADQIPIGRVGVPSDIAKVVAFLASTNADYMTGQSINVTGGLLMH